MLPNLPSSLHSKFCRKSLNYGDNFPVVGSPAVAAIEETTPCIPNCSRRKTSVQLRGGWSCGCCQRAISSTLLPVKRVAFNNPKRFHAVVKHRHEKLKIKKKDNNLHFCLRDKTIKKYPPVILKTTLKKDFYMKHFSFFKVLRPIYTKFHFIKTEKKIHPHLCLHKA